ncbi:Transcriptional regulator of nonfermentable carbon utilization [Collariella sp. IMI 366227]|nr:Transcriptional regulator of nonfermentable carbon utilization [Collariella sp. IMI 366227]
MPEDSGLSGAEASGAMSESENEYDENDMLVKDEDEKMADRSVTSEGPDVEVKKKYDPKDPLRPRRKKARRACFACQRAHLTCGDERPCQRCIKRGLMDSCQDGVRKKAKYLHDAPPEALRPVLGPNYNPNPSSRQNGHRHPSISASEASSAAGTFFSQSTATQFPIFSAAQTPIASIAGDIPFGPQQTPVSPSFQTSRNQINGLPVSSPMATFGALPFDPSDPNIFNFNLEGLNFGSQYGALEFNMLGHMSSGAAETPPQDGPMPRTGSGTINFGSGVFANGASQFDKMYEGGMLDAFLGLDANQHGVYPQGNLQHGLPHAYAIAAGPTSVQSPSTDNNSPQPTNLGFDASPTMATYTAPPGGTKQRSSTRQSNALTKLGQQSILGKRQRDPSFIYDTVKEPFGYVTSFHKLFNLIQSRFAAAHTSRIAKSLASIRPPLLASTRNLTRQDLVFMEKYFQRSLFEYEEFMHQCSSPTLACRRTGEVASVNKEFTALTGWTKDVLLGKEPNRNVNLGDSAAASTSSKGRLGLATPRLKSLNADATDTPQPVFLAELLDHESVVEFYEDYSQLAFGDSRGHKTRKCRLLKYRTQEQAESTGAESNGEEQQPTPQQQQQKDPRNSILSNRVAKIDGEHGISKLERDGKLECSYTWTIKRDMFDMPMLFIINPTLPSQAPSRNIAVEVDISNECLEPRVIQFLADEPREKEP